MSRARSSRDRRGPAEWFAGLASSVTRADDGWRVEFDRNGESVSAEVHFDDDWLVVDGALPAPPRGAGERASGSDSNAGSNSGSNSDWEWLNKNGSFAGVAKIARSTAEPGLRFRAELPFEQPLRGELDDVQALRLDELRDSLLEVCRSARGESTALTPGEGGAGDPMPVPGLTASELSQLCEQSGWPCELRNPGSVLVDLETAPHFWQAQVSSAVPGGLVLRVDLPAASAAAAECSAAQAHFLLRAAAFLRMVRPAASRDEAAGWKPRFEVRLGDRPGADELGHALSALSVASRLTAEELRVLGADPRIAAIYLAQQSAAMGSGFHDPCNP